MVARSSLLIFIFHPRGFFRGFCHGLTILEIKERETRQGEEWMPKIAVKTSIDGPADERLVEVKVLFSCRPVSKPRCHLPIMWVA